MTVPPPHVVEATNRIQEFRGWILSSYAQIEYLFSDLVLRGCKIEEYQQLGGSLPYHTAKRLKRARAILGTSGPFAQFSGRLLPLLDSFEEKSEIRNILAHGFMTIRHDAQGRVEFEFRKWHWTEEGEQTELFHRCFEVHLDYEAHQLKALASETSELFREIHQSLGLVE